MTELSTDREGVHGTGLLRMSYCGPLTEGTDVLGALGAYMFQGLALETLNNSWGCGMCVGDGDGVVTGSGLQNHLQSSREHNMSRAHSRSTSSGSPSPASLSQCSVMMILFPWGKGRCSP